MKSNSKIFWCKNCLNMSTRPRIKFDDRGFCNACQWSEIKKKVDWRQRENYLKKLIKKYKSFNDNFDCIVPVSGGKDGSYVAHTLKTKYKLRPLTVTSRPPLTLSVGDKNLENFVRSGFDHIHVTPNERSMKIINKLGLIHMGFPYYGWLVSIFGVVIRTALTFNIPLVFYGENGEVEYGGNFDQNKLFLETSEIEKIFLEDGYKKVLKLSKLKEEELYWFKLPKTYKKNKNKLHLTWWSCFEPWDSYKNYLVAKKYCNLQEYDESNSGTFTNFAQTDQALYDLHTYIMYLKFGFGRATQDVGIEIRRGAMTRDQGKSLVKIYDGKFPDHNLDLYLDYYEMNKDEFFSVLEKWVNKKLFTKSKDGYSFEPNFKVE
ncbi:N-acetyl sugar amidotransferase [Candidatus Pelagibacter sp.]|jgi:N-acetyl sugar amidotransferase|nr:N-acetyl sugar amidotransferase [Candidatus Pelagibacter sp.]